MSDWQDISTAPIDTVVELGGWYCDPYCIGSDGKPELEWTESYGYAFETGTFGVRKRCCPKFVTHWRLVALDPPKDMNTETTNQTVESANATN